MSYQNWEYTNPGWNNNTPPPLSSSNLNDIASALEKLNISDEQIATIKSYLTDVSGYDQIQNGLGQLASVLATARNSDKESIDNLNEQVQQKGNCNIGTLQYTGNGTQKITLNIGRKPDIMFITNALEDTGIYPAYSMDTITEYVFTGVNYSYPAKYSNGVITIDVNGTTSMNYHMRIYNVVYFY